MKQIYHIIFWSAEHREQEKAEEYRKEAEKLKKEFENQKRKTAVIVMGG